jgi:hypothetical protein
MAEPILYMGPSGCGKSSSLRNLPAEQSVIIKPNAKSLPFPGGDVNYVVGKNMIINAELDAVSSIIQHVNDNLPDVKYVILEDFTHTFSARIFSPSFLSRNSGGEAFQRWNDFGASVFQAIFAHSQKWRADLYIVVIHHTEIKEDGTIGFKSAGKLLENTIDFPSYFTYIFHGVVQQTDTGSQYMIQTNKDSIRQAKTPYGVFPTYIPNDMKVILDRITDYRQGKLNIEFK